MQNRNAMIFIFITIALDATGLGMIIAPLPNLIAEVAHIPSEESKSLYGLIIMAYAFMQFLFAPVVGGLSDRFGRRPVLLLSLLGLAMDYTIMYFAPTLFWLVLGRLVSGMFGASYSTASAYIADISTPENKTRNFGMVGAAFGVGFIIGPAIGGLLGEYGLRMPFLAAGALAFLNFLYGLLILKETLPVEKRRRFSFLRSNPLGALFQMSKYKALGLMFLTIFLYYIAGTAVQTTWVFLTQEKFQWSLGDIGISLAVVGVCVAIVQGGLAGMISRSFGNVKTAYAGLVAFFVSVIAIGLATQGWMLYVLMLPYAFTGLAGPTIQAIMSNNTKDTEQGELQGTITSVVSLSEVVGPLVMTGLLAFTTENMPQEERFYGTPYLAAAGFILIATVLFRRATKNYKEADSTTVSEEQDDLLDDSQELLEELNSATSGEGGQRI